MTNANSPKENNALNQQLKEAIEHWGHISFIKYPRDKKHYKFLVAILDKLLERVGNNENHKLIGLVDMVSSLIAAYEEEHYPAPKIRGIVALKYLIESHQLKQADLKEEIGSQGVVSEVLNGKRELNARQIKLLAKRFHIDPSTFIDLDD